MEIPPVTAPKTTVSNSACSDIFLIRFSSPLPTALEIIASTATPAAPEILLINQVIVVVTLTAAVACSPSLPTIAVSTYCSSVCSISSNTVGIDNVISIRSISLLSVSLSLIAFSVP